MCEGASVALELALDALPRDALVCIFRNGDRAFLRNVASCCRRFLHVVKGDRVLRMRAALPVFERTGTCFATAAFQTSVPENATPAPMRQSVRAVPISPSIFWTRTPGRFNGADTPAHRAAGRIGVTRQNRKEKRKKHELTYLL
jgi:hypothetical protein